ncbi:MAG: hypothetical protein AAFP68_18475, partial [Pseudomonadota bacterium]
IAHPLVVQGMESRSSYQSEGFFRASTWEKFRFSKETSDRKSAYVDLMDRIKQDPPVLPLWRPFESWGMKANVGWAPKPGHIPYVLDFRAGSITLGGS